MSNKLGLPNADQAEVEAAVRRYLSRVARRYSPLLIGFVVLLLVVALVPSVTPEKRTEAQSTGQDTQAGGGSGATTDSTIAGATATNGAAGPTGGAAAAGASRGIAVPRGITAAAAAGSAGVTRSGVNCGPGVRQVPWSKYAPICIPAYKGNNGGNTSPATQGVTGDTITLSFRRTNSAEEKAAFSIARNAAPGSDDEYLSDLRAYVDLFNKNYELYGRHVVVKDYQPQGDNLEEDQGRDLAGAQADASKAKDLGAFADVTQSPSLAATVPYMEYLAGEKVIGIGAIGITADWFKRLAPYEFSPIPDATKAAVAGVHALCQRSAGMPAIFAGDPLYKNQQRKFGLVSPDYPEALKAADVFQNGLRRECGVKFERRISYTIDVARFGDQSASMAAQMKAAGVTTLICACDPLVEITFSQAADGQQYHPEWLVTNFYDPQARETSQNEWKNAIAGTYIKFPPRAQRESYRIFKLSRPNTEPAERYFDLAYQMAVYTFSALQGAGPNLNPQTFQQAMFNMPRSELGELGTWGGGAQAFTPNLDAIFGWWDPNRVSDFDGGKGMWVPCEGGRWFPYDDPSTYGPAHTQVHCFGQ
ncbi:MAG: hypothetical protein JWP02_2749 [Acidimicrobiales bacterium]|nr:hypothetical protein [Acidimicrobiales bacterium]